MVDAIEPKWALILGASSGFGAACALALARQGFNIVGVHLDRKATAANADRIAATIGEMGQQAMFFNVNAADPERRAEVIRTVCRVAENNPGCGGIRTMLHSIAFGTLKLHRIEAACIPANVASVRLLEKTGFKREGFARQYLCIDGAWQDHLLYARIRDDPSP